MTIRSELALAGAALALLAAAATALPAVAHRHDAAPAAVARVHRPAGDVPVVRVVPGLRPGPLLNGTVEGAPRD
ncbi:MULTISPECIES: hypothetical protein [Streptomyces]|jgi:hypothetical protein|uniref:Uncharacterized protein n=2 Tax=Streptomyces griseoaurantiacus TaxID=68213 RepID=A0A1G7WQQ3_9ACTN|nr:MULTISPECIES: hypothetical protein [Streptomyces]MBA5220050.1 hypothetical protein [Streptomyces griseoaurantiacus]MDX3089545.1 hypothetical protein [Streptomyces sp. ME12-02E]MDX3332969.1 hypothetical protein [Streptomyces sp. ME02-6978a]MDX3359062.1 hypothetical protein [Streptomyces sp. ME02-6978.2a]WTI30146.1 hypothetical protein OHA67_29390 [Streptomyces jietaisiensis]